MRDPKRISKVIKELEEFWKYNPDLRLGQLISNLNYEITGTNDPFYIEDDKLLDVLVCYNKLHNKSREENVKMFRKLRDIPEVLGNINGEDYAADILVKLTTDEAFKSDIKVVLQENKTITADKIYHVHKVTGYGDVFDVWITNDLDQEESFGEWIFEDVD